VRRSYERVRAALAASPLDLGVAVVDGADPGQNLIGRSLYNKHAFQGSGLSA
jgi:hypothetical protein